MQPPVKIGTRDSELAVWQANQVKMLLSRDKIESELVFIKSEGDLDTVKPLYELGVQGIFTKALDAALLDNRIDIAVHSMKDVPTKLADGIRQAAVLKRGSFKDIIVFKYQRDFLEDKQRKAVIATSSLRRSAQWLHRFPNHTIENLRGNVNTRLKKVTTNEWDGAIFAAAGLERINLRPQNSEDLDWMLPAPAQGAIVIVCRDNDRDIYNCCKAFNDADAERCTCIERSFLRELQGGCTTPISALALIDNGNITFKGNICSPDGKIKIDVEKKFHSSEYENAGIEAARELLKNHKAIGILKLTHDGSK